MIEELVMVTARGEPRPGLAVLIAASFVRDEVPWLYDMAAEAYRLSLLGNTEAENRAVREFLRGWEMVTYGPFTRELNMSKDLHMAFRELPMLLDRFMPGLGNESDMAG